MTKAQLLNILLTFGFFGNVICRECYNAAGMTSHKYYNGTNDRTVHGTVCQRWDSQTPHSHFRNEDYMFLGETVEEASNYCRDAYWNGELFCYTTNPNITYELCSVPNCTDPNGIHMVTADTEMMRCRYLPENGSCNENEEYFCRDTYTVMRSELPRRRCEKLFCCVRKGCRYQQSHEYNGTWSHSADGEPCRFWNEYNSSPPDPNNFPEKSLDGAMNYCRDPDNSGFLWCYSYRGIRGGAYAQEPCDIPTCDEYTKPQQYNNDCYEITTKDVYNYAGSEIFNYESVCEAVPERKYFTITSDSFPPGCERCGCCQKKGCYSGDMRNYTGTWSVTANGLRCRFWNETSLKNEDSVFPDATVTDAYNYCRYTSNYDDRGLWCYTTDENIPEDNCDIPRCEEDSEQIVSTYIPDVTTIYETGEMSYEPTESVLTNSTSISETTESSKANIVRGETMLKYTVLSVATIVGLSNL